MPRPSSPLGAKASTRCPSTLEHLSSGLTPDDAPHPRPGKRAGLRPQRRHVAGRTPPRLERHGPMRHGQATRPQPRHSSGRPSRPGDPSRDSPGRRSGVRSSSSPCATTTGRAILPTADPEPRSSRKRSLGAQGRHVARDRHRLRAARSGFSTRNASHCVAPAARPWKMVEANGLEPMTSGLQSRRSPN